MSPQKERAATLVGLYVKVVKRKPCLLNIRVRARLYAD